MYDFLTNGASSSSESIVVLLRFGGDGSVFGSFLITIVVSFLTTGVVDSFLIVGVVASFLTAGLAVVDVTSFFTVDV